MKKIVTSAGLLIAIALGLVFILVNQNENQLSVGEIREKFRCDRFTADVLATDIYCSNPNYYYDDAENNTLIDESDFDDPRYESMFEQSTQAETSKFNPNYADAIQLGKPELCKDIEYALQSGPTDAIERQTGSRAVATCERQAEAGFFACECDSDAVLNAMRVQKGQ